jgi:hypothetical protein
MKKNYIGTWLIAEMELWDKEFIDLVAPGQIKIEKDGTGSLSFGAFESCIDCKIEKIGNQEILSFTFEGSDEGDLRSGRGWAILDEKEMNGRIFFHMGDDSRFKVRKKP